MPFRPPNFSKGGGNDPLQAIGLLLRLREDQRAEQRFQQSVSMAEEEARRKADDQLITLGMQNPDVNLDKIAGAIPAASAAGLQAAKEIQKGARKKAEAAAETESIQNRGRIQEQAGRLAPGVAAEIDRLRTRGVDPRRATVQAFRGLPEGPVGNEAARLGSGQFEEDRLDIRQFARKEALRGAQDRRTQNLGLESMADVIQQTNPKLKRSEALVLAQTAAPGTDPDTGAFTVYATKAARTKRMEVIAPLESRIFGPGGLQDLAEQIRADVTERAGPVVGTAGIQSALRTFGKQTPGAAEFESVLNLTLTQVGRASGEKGVMTDRDIARVAAALPSLVDIGNPAIEGRFRATRTFLESEKVGLTFGAPKNIPELPDTEELMRDPEIRRRMAIIKKIIGRAESQIDVDRLTSEYFLGPQPTKAAPGTGPLGGALGEFLDTYTPGERR